MEVRQNAFDYVDLSYFLGNIKETSKFVANGKLKIYCFAKDNLIIVSKTEKNYYTLFINHDTLIEDVIDYCDKIMNELQLDTINLVKEDMENLTVDKCENIYYTLLTEDNVPIILDETYFDVIPKDGDILDSSLKILEKETTDKKEAINNKFQSLLKRK